MVLAAFNLEEVFEPVTDPKKKALLDAAISLFGERGFDGVSVRDICKSAGTNVAAVSYHFNGKQDLYEACAFYIIGQVRSHLGDVVVEVMEFVQSGEDDADRALELLLRFVGRMVEFLVPDSDKAAAWAPFVTRFRMDMSASLRPELKDMGGLIMSHLVGIACNTPGQTLRNGAMAQSFIGQVQVYRVSRGAALQSLGLETVGPKELDEIKSVILGNVRAMILAVRADA